MLHERFDGYAGCTDAPAFDLVPELLHAYPDAIVICTTRSPTSWVQSMQTVQSAATTWFLRFVLFPIPGMRHFVEYIDLLRMQFDVLYNEHDPVTTRTYERHVQWLKEVVPPERLVFFDVKEGWGPLCKALGKEVPEGVEFPRINDSEAIDSFAKAIVKKGLIRWLVVFATFGLAMIPFWYV
jgi:hypothetical protein